MSLEETSKRLETAFIEAEAKLDTVGEKVDSALVECENQTGSANSIVSENVSATHLLKQVHEVKTEFKSIINQVDELKKDHEHFLAEILQELQNASIAVESLKSVAPDESQNVDTVNKEHPKHAPTKSIAKKKCK